MRYTKFAREAACLTITAAAWVLPPSALAASCPADTVYVGEDDNYLFCRRMGDYVGADQATRAAILRNGMRRLRLPYHLVKGRCLDGDVTMCPLNDEDHAQGCLDCSAFVFDVLRSVGVRATPSAQHQFEYFKSLPGGIKTSEPVIGDVIFFKDTASHRVKHTGIYVGMRDGHVYYLNASYSRQEVWVSRMPKGKMPYAFGNVSMIRIKRED